MNKHAYSEQELKFTAMLYATRADVIKSFKETEKLPDFIPLGGFPVAMKVLEQQWGRGYHAD